MLANQWQLTNTRPMSEVKTGGEIPRFNKDNIIVTGLTGTPLHNIYSRFIGAPNSIPETTSLLGNLSSAINLAASDTFDDPPGLVIVLPKDMDAWLDSFPEPASSELMRKLDEDLTALARLSVNDYPTRFLIADSEVDEYVVADLVHISRQGGQPHGIAWMSHVQELTEHIEV